MLNQRYQQAIKLIEQRAYQQAHQCLLEILSQDRSYADAYYLMAVIAAEHGNFAKAISIAERALGFEQKVEYMVFIAKLFVQMHDHVNAKAWADKALSSDDKDDAGNSKITGSMLDNLGVVYSQVGQHFLATRIFERAIASSNAIDVPAQLHTNLASSYKFCGDFDGAKRHYKFALEKDTRCYVALWSLASLGELPSEQQVKLLTGILESNDQALGETSQSSGSKYSIKDKLHIAHTLARYHEKYERFDVAYELLTKVKAAKKQKLGYQFEQDLALFDALIERFTIKGKPETSATSLNQKSVFGPDGSANNNGSANTNGSEAIFIVGMPRTGTTVVERLLSQPENITSAGEMQHFSITLKQMSKTGTSALLDLDVISATENIDWHRLGQAYLESTRAITGQTQRFIDKMPLNFLYVGFILSALPNAKIVWLDRALEDTMVSNFRQLFAIDFPFYHYSYDLSDIHSYYQAHHKLGKIWLERFPNNFYQLDYQAFVGDPEHHGKLLYEFIGEPWCDDYLSLSGNASPVATASATQVRDKVSNKSVGFWRHYANQVEAAIKST